MPASIRLPASPWPNSARKKPTTLTPSAWLLSELDGELTAPLFPETSDRASRSKAPAESAQVLRLQESRDLRAAVASVPDRPRPVSDPSDSRDRTRTRSSNPGRGVK